MRNSVAIQGIKGSYSEEAARALFGASAETVECADFEETFQAVLSKTADYAVVPFKNKIVGAIEKPNALLKKTNLRILEEISIKIQHVLIGTQDGEFENLKAIFSHPEALKQCRRFLLENQNLQLFAGADTASCVRQIIEKNNAAHSAIGSRRAAEIYGAKILKENIADEIENETVFYLLGN